MKALNLRTKVVSFTVYPLCITGDVYKKWDHNDQSDNDTVYKTIDPK